MWPTSAPFEAIGHYASTFAVAFAFITAAAGSLPPLPPLMEVTVQTPACN